MKKLCCIILALILSFTMIISAFASQTEEIKLGDVNLDGTISIMDASEIQMYIASYIELSELSLKQSDVDSNGEIAIVDVSLIQRYIAKIIDTFPNSPTQPSRELQELSEKISKLQTESTLTLSLFADIHYDEYDSFSSVKEKKIEELSTLQSLVNIDYVANLGDFVIGNTNKETTISSLKKLLKLTDDAATCPLLNVRGNHDDNGWYSQGGYGGTYKADEIINDKEWCDLTLSSASKSLIIDNNNPYGGYGYIDHEASKTRIFMLNSCDIPYILEEDGTYRYSSYTGHAFSNAQLNFVADALMFSDKENPSDWAALFLTHVPLDTSNADNERFGGKSALIRGHEYMLSIISAYRKGTSFQGKGSTYIPSYKNDRQEDFLVDIDVDYSKKGRGEVIAFLNGHTHTDNYSDEVGIENSLSYGYTFIGTSGSEGFANLVINRENKTISVLKHGAIYPENNFGTLTKTPDVGTIESGEWSVTYDQFVPDGKNLSNGMSDLHPTYYNIDDNITSGIDLDTLEVIGTVETTSPYRVTKAIAVKPYTTYILPKNFNGVCLSFNNVGSKRAYIKVTDNGSHKTLTTGIRTSYIVFSINIDKYSDYENFYIKETAYGVEY